MKDFPILYLAEIMAGQAEEFGTDIYPGRTLWRVLEVEGNADRSSILFETPSGIFREDNQKDVTTRLQRIE